MTRAVINVTPLIDVLLVLLIIFMIITPVKPSTFKTKIPQEPDRSIPPPNNHPDTLIVSIDLNAGLALNQRSGLGSITEPQKLIEALQQTFATRLENYAGSSAVPHNVFIRAPRELDYGSVVKVIDAVKLAGADPIALQIDDFR
ncbi:MAG: biopolymer transporter ExbD [Acidobacteria bacterium]|nr:biopolymer transporter ExbD [Acidobacteriota bacterium]